MTSDQRCDNHGCDQEARWTQEGRRYCRKHGTDAAIRTGRPIQRLPFVADDQAHTPDGAHDPVDVWDELEAQWWQTPDEPDSIEEYVFCLIDQGKTQAMELARLRGGVTQ
jgi:hypothetical protein